MFRPLWGGPANMAGTPAFARSGRVSSARPDGRVSACGESASSDSNEAEGTFEVKVVSAKFPTEQQLGQTSLLKLGVKNTGDKKIPALTIGVSIAGKEGQTSSLPFGIHDPQPDLAQPDRPVWVLAEGYPRLDDGSTTPAGAKTSSPKTFDFGSLEPGETVEGVWKLSAVKAGKYTLLYGVDAGLSGKAKAKTSGGVKPGGSFSVDISTKADGNRSHRLGRSRRNRQGRQGHARSGK